MTNKELIIYPGSKTYYNSIFYLFDPITKLILDAQFCNNSTIAKIKLCENIKEYENIFNNKIIIKFLNDSIYDYSIIFNLIKK